MPYISESGRQDMDGGLAPEEPGELNYVITKLINAYIESCTLNYNAINEVLGVLTACQLELYRRVAAPYEDQKIEANGDVYTVS